jgi:hypothetical protein
MGARSGVVWSFPGDKSDCKESQFLRSQVLMVEQCDKHFWINGALITAVNNAGFLVKFVTNGDIITVLSLVVKAYKATG